MRKRKTQILGIVLITFLTAMIAHAQTVSGSAQNSYRKEEHGIGIGFGEYYQRYTISLSDKAFGKDYIQYTINNTYEETQKYSRNFTTKYRSFDWIDLSSTLFSSKPVRVDLRVRRNENLTMSPQHQLRGFNDLLSGQITINSPDFPSIRLYDEIIRSNGMANTNALTNTSEVNIYSYGMNSQIEATYRNEQQRVIDRFADNRQYSRLQGSTMLWEKKASLMTTIEFQSQEHSNSSYATTRLYSTFRERDQLTFTHLFHYSNSYRFDNYANTINSTFRRYFTDNLSGIVLVNYQGIEARNATFQTVSQISSIETGPDYYKEELKDNRVDRTSIHSFLTVQQSQLDGSGVGGKVGYSRTRVNRWFKNTQTELTYIGDYFNQPSHTRHENSLLNTFITDNNIEWNNWIQMKCRFSISDQRGDRQSMKYEFYLNQSSQLFTDLTFQTAWTNNEEIIPNAFRTSTLSNSLMWYFGYQIEWVNQSIYTLNQSTNVKDILFESVLNVKLREVKLSLQYSNDYRQGARNQGIFGSVIRTFGFNYDNR